MRNRVIFRYMSIYLRVLFSFIEANINRIEIRQYRLGFSKCVIKEYVIYRFFDEIVLKMLQISHFIQGSMVKFKHEYTVLLNSNISSLVPPTNNHLRHFDKFAAKKMSKSIASSNTSKFTDYSKKMYICNIN